MQEGRREGNYFMIFARPARDFYLFFLTRTGLYLISHGGHVFEFQGSKISGQFSRTRGHLQFSH